MTRITSTYVEKTALPLVLLPEPWDHLHIRGENRLLLLANVNTLGSPPHTWRKQA